VPRQGPPWGRGGGRIGVTWQDGVGRVGRNFARTRRTHGVESQLVALDEVVLLYYRTNTVTARRGADRRPAARAPRLRGERP
jgi:hypothetical protein